MTRPESCAHYEIFIYSTNSVYIQWYNRTFCTNRNIPCVSANLHSMWQSDRNNLFYDFVFLSELLSLSVSHHRPIYYPNTCFFLFFFFVFIFCCLNYERMFIIDCFCVRWSSQFEERLEFVSCLYASIGILYEKLANQIPINE